MEGIKVPDAGFKTMVIKMLKDVTERMDDLRENLNKEMVSMKTIKKHQSRVNNITSEMKNAAEGFGRWRQHRWEQNSLPLSAREIPS